MEITFNNMVNYSKGESLTSQIIAKNSSVNGPFFRSQLNNLSLNRLDRHDVEHTCRNLNTSTRIQTGYNYNCAGREINIPRIGENWDKQKSQQLSPELLVQLQNVFYTCCPSVQIHPLYNC